MLTKDSQDLPIATPVKNSERTVRRANESIGMRPTSGKLTLLSRRVFHMMILFIQQDGDKEIYRRALGEFMKSMEYGSKDISLLVDTINSLQHVTVEWNSDSFDSDNEVWHSEITSNLVSEVSIIRKGRGHEVFVEWSFAPKLREKLLDPHFYTRFSVVYFSLRSSASVALFEIIERYKTNPTKKTNREPWQWWVPRITGSLSENYEYKYFKRDVLRPAIAEINTLVTDYELELLEHRDDGGRKITSIQFAIHPLQQKKLDIDIPPLINGNLVEKLMSFGMSESDARKIFSENEEGDIEKTIELTEKRAQNKSLAPVVSKAGYFKNALLGKYASVQPETTLVKKSAKLAKLRAESTPAEKYAARQRVRSEEHFNLLPEKGRQGFIDNYFAHNNVSAVVAGYKKSGLKSTLFRQAFFEWLAIHLWGEPTVDEIEAFLSELEVA